VVLNCIDSLVGNFKVCIPKQVCNNSGLWAIICAGGPFFFFFLFLVLLVEYCGGGSVYMFMTCNLLLVFIPL
jgi:hypothetical protein